MALGTYANALTAIREVLDDGTGNLRTISATRFTDDLDPSVGEPERQRRGIRADKPFRVRFLRQRRHEASPPIIGSIILYRFDVEVTVSRTIATEAQLDPDLFAELEALAWEDTDAIRQALCTPPNLDTTAASAPTNLISGALTYVESVARVVPIQGDGAQRYETINKFTVGLKVSPATS